MNLAGIFGVQLDRIRLGLLTASHAGLPVPALKPATATPKPPAKVLPFVPVNKDRVRALRREANRRLRDKRMLLGQCVRCSQPAVDGQIHCVGHLEAMRNYMRDYERKRKKARRHGAA